MRGVISVTTDAGRIDLGLAHRWIASTYWATGIPWAWFERACAHSLLFAALDGEVQVGFARVVTDQATFAWLADVFVAEAERGRGVASRLLGAIIGDPRLQGLAPLRAHHLGRPSPVREVRVRTARRHRRTLHGDHALGVGAVPGLSAPGPPRGLAQRAARTVARCCGERGFTASRTVTPEARRARGSSHSKTSSGRLLAVSRSTQPIALRMKNSVSSSIPSAYRANRAKSPPPRRSGTSRASSADRRIQRSGSLAQRSSTAPSSGWRSTSPPTTTAASSSTSAQVRASRSSRSTRPTSDACKTIAADLQQLDGDASALVHPPLPEGLHQGEQVLPAEGGPPGGDPLRHRPDGGNAHPKMLQVTLQVRPLLRRPLRGSVGSELRVDLLDAPGGVRSVHLRRAGRQQCLYFRAAAARAGIVARGGSPALPFGALLDGEHSHDRGDPLTGPAQPDHPLEVGKHVLEGHPVSLAEVVETRLPVGRECEAVLGTSAVAEEADRARPADGGEARPFGLTECDLRRRADQRAEAIVGDVPQPVAWVDEMVAGVDAAVVLEGQHPAAGLGHHAEVGGGPAHHQERLGEVLDRDPAHVVADPLVEDGAEEAGHGPRRDRPLGDTAIRRPLHDGEELHPAHPLVEEEAIHLERRRRGARVEGAEQVRLDAVGAQPGQAPHRPGVGRVPPAVGPAAIVEPGRPVDAQADREAVLGEEGAPVVVEPGPVGLQVVDAPPSRGQVAPLQLHHSPVEGEPGEGGLAPVPGEADQGPRARLDEGADVGLEHLVAHPVALTGREEAGLAQVVAVVAGEVAEGSDRLGHDHEGLRLATGGADRGRRRPPPAGAWGAGWAGIAFMGGSGER